MKTFVRSLCILGALVGVIPLRSTAAQGVTSAAVVGKIADDAGEPIPSASLTLTNTSTGPAAASAEQHDTIAANLRRVAFVAVLVVPLARLQPALDVDLFPLRQVFR